MLPEDFALYEKLEIDIDSIDPEENESDRCKKLEQLANFTKQKNALLGKMCKMKFERVVEEKRTQIEEEKKLAEEERRKQLEKEEEERKKQAEKEAKLREINKKKPQRGAQLPSSTPDKLGTADPDNIQQEVKDQKKQEEQNCT